MWRRVLPVGLVVAAASAGAQGHPRLGFYLLVAAIPAAAAAALALFGEVLDASGNANAGVLRLELALAVGGLGLLLVAAAARAGSAEGEAVPALSATALGACVGVLVTQALLAFVAPPPAEAA